MCGPVSYTHLDVYKRQELTSSLKTKIGAMLVKNGLSRMKKTFSQDNNSGAPLLGVKGISIVCHGNSDAKGIVLSLIHILLAKISRSKATWQPGRKKQHARSGRLDRGRCGYPYHRPWLIPAFVLICRQSQGSLQRRE